MLSSLLPAVAQAADSLPNAAAHIGTVVINGDAQFTTNLAVTLTLNAVDDGNGIAQMQFSNDELTWSSPEPYQTTKPWVLPNKPFPPAMSTVLETVYVRFRDGAGQWSKAVSDSIVFARTPLDVPQLVEVWIAQSQPTNYDGTQPPGSQLNPWIVPAGQNEPQFDSLMHSLMLSNQNYVTMGTNASSYPTPATNMTALTVHIGPGVYQTHGACRSWGDNLAWSPSYGWRIIGAGRDATMLQGTDYGYGNKIEVVGGYYGDIASYDNIEVSDLTLDANLHQGETNYQGRIGYCIFFTGNNIQIRRVRTKNFGTTVAGYEIPGGIGLLNFGSQYGNFNGMIEDCEIIQAQVGNAYKSGMLQVWGSYGADGTLRYWNNIIVRNCYIDGAAYDGNTPVDPMQYASDDRGRTGVQASACKGAIVEDNLVLNVPSGFYLDGIGLHDITIRNNHFRNVLIGWNLSLFSGALNNRLEDTFRFDNNLVELDPQYFPAGDIGGWRIGFNLSTDRQGSDYTYNNFVINSNVFQFTDQSPPATNVQGVTTGGLVSFRTAEVTGNTFLNLSLPIVWFNAPSYLDQQVNIVDTNQAVPLVCQQNTREDCTIVEAYPPVLDASLPRPTAVAGSLVSFPAPTLNGSPAVLVTGVPAVARLQGGNFVWQTGSQDAGKYVVGFYKDTNRLSDPRYTLITVLPSVPDTDPHYFSDALAGYWKMDETSGTTFYDSSGNGRAIDISGALSAQLLSLGAPGNAPGKIAAQFTNSPFTSGQVFAIVDTNQELFSGLASNYFPLLAETTSLFHPFTLSFWFKMPSEPQTYQVLFYDGFALSVEPGTNLNNDLAILHLWTVTDRFVNLATPEVITVGAWHHAALVYDGFADRVYVDGSMVAQLDSGQLVDLSPSYLGVGGGPNFVGSMGEVTIWGRALSDAEIARVRTDQSGSLDPVATPLAPSNLSAQLGLGGSVFLSWQDNSLNETGFVLQRSSNGITFTTVASLPQDTTAFTDSLANTNGTYFYRVAAFNAFGSSDDSSVAILGSCAYVLDYTGTNVGAAACSGSFGVNGTLGCPWTAQVSNGSDWIQTSSSGICPGAVTFTVSANPMTAPRSGTIAVQGQVFTITQTQPVQPVKGTYSALLAASTNPAPSQAGLVTVTTATKGSFSGSLLLGSKTFPLRGKFDVGGQARVTVRRHGLSSLNLVLMLDANDPDLLSGNIGDGTWSAGLSGSRSVFDGRSSLSPQTGRYTMVISGKPASGGEPTGDSFGSVHVDKTGRVSFAGTLADGTAVTRSGVVTKGAQWALYLPLYAGQGFVSGQLNFVATGSNDLSGELTWTKLGMTKAKFFRSGFVFQTAASGALYTRPAAGSAVLPFSSGQVVLSGGDLTQTITNQITLGGNNLATGASQLKLSFAPSTGLFRGTAVSPASGEKLTLGGVVLQKSSFGSGLFKGKAAIGRAYVGP